MVARPNRKVSDLANLLNLTSFDCALPRQFFLDFKETTGHDPRGSIVFCYDNGALGTPRPLTADARDALEKYNDARGSRFPTDVPVVAWQVTAYAHDAETDETEKIELGTFRAYDAARDAADDADRTPGTDVWLEPVRP